VSNIVLVAYVLVGGIWINAVCLRNNRNATS